MAHAPSTVQVSKTRAEDAAQFVREADKRRNCNGGALLQESLLNRIEES
jgi:hypothetical protein